MDDYQKRGRGVTFLVKNLSKNHSPFPISNPSSPSSLLLCSLRLFFISSLLYFSVTLFSLAFSPLSLSPSPLSVFHLQTNRSILLTVRSSDGGAFGGGQPRSRLRFFSKILWEENWKNLARFNRTVGSRFRWFTAKERISVFYV